MTRSLLGPALVAYNGYDAGLGNRIRVTLGAKSLAELEGRSFYYVWPTGKLFGPRFADLWEFDAGRTVHRATSRLLAKRWAYVDHDVPGWLDDAKRRERLWQIRTGNEITLPPGARSWREEFRALVPSAEIASRVIDLYDRHLAGTPYLGVNVRAHSVSHDVTRVASPVEWYLTRLKQIRHEQPDLPIFISCDVPEVQRRIEAEVPGSFGQHDKGGYNTLEGVRSAVVDLYLLAAAGHLIGPHFSSFVHLAEHLNGDVVPLETSTSAPPPNLDLGRLARTPDPLRPAERIPWPTAH